MEFPKTSSEANAQNARIELEHILLELSDRPKNPQHLRHFVDQHYCYKHGYVKRSGVADWESIVWKGHVSCEARKLGDRKLVVKEHVVPLKVIGMLLLELTKSGHATIEDIEEILNNHVKFATISKNEDRILRRKGLTSKMPDGFFAEGHKYYRDVFARYKEAEIAME